MTPNLKKSGMHVGNIWDLPRISGMNVGTLCDACGQHLGCTIIFWNACEKYLGFMWETSVVHVGSIWDSCGKYLVCMWEIMWDSCGK